MYSNNNRIPDYIIKNSFRDVFFAWNSIISLCTEAIKDRYSLEWKGGDKLDSLQLNLHRRMQKLHKLLQQLAGNHDAQTVHLLKQQTIYLNEFSSSANKFHSDATGKNKDIKLINAIEDLAKKANTDMIIFNRLIEACITQPPEGMSDSQNSMTQSAANQSDSVLLYCENKATESTSSTVSLKNETIGAINPIQMGSAVSDAAMMTADEESAITSVTTENDGQSTEKNLEISTELTKLNIGNSGVELDKTATANLTDACLALSATEISLKVINAPAPNADERVDVTYNKDLAIEELPSDQVISSSEESLLPIPNTPAIVCSNAVPTETVNITNVADSLPTPTACDALSTAPEALQAEVAPQTLAERCEADRNLLTLKRLPSAIAPSDPLFRAGYVNWAELENSSWAAYFFNTPQTRKLIANVVAKSALGTSAWDSHVQLVKMLQRICTQEDEQGCYNVINDKHLEFPCAWFKVELCPVWPLKNGGELSFENFWAVPDIIYRKNHQTLPAVVDQNKPGISRLHKARTSMPGQRISGKTFFKRCLQDKGVNHVLEFIRQGMPLVNGAPIIDREPPVVERPVLGLLYRECMRHQPFNRYCKGLEHLNLLFAEQSGIQEATALVCFDAVTLGNPDNIMDTLLQMATDTYLTAETEEARQAGKDALIARVHGWLYETFQLGILHTPQQFEKKLYTRMFSHPPVHLHW